MEKKNLVVLTLDTNINRVGVYKLISDEISARYDIKFTENVETFFIRERKTEEGQNEKQWHMEQVGKDFGTFLNNLEKLREDKKGLADMDHGTIVGVYDSSDVDDLLHMLDKAHTFGFCKGVSFSQL